MDSETKIGSPKIDTIVVSARKEGFQEIFLRENMWRAIRINSSMVTRIRYLAVYQAFPVSAITHLVKVDRIEPWKDTWKYALYFATPPEQIRPIKLVPKGKVKGPQRSRYTSLARIRKAKTLEDVF